MALSDNPLIAKKIKLLRQSFAPESKTNFCSRFQFPYGTWDHWERSGKVSAEGLRILSRFAENHQRNELAEFFKLEADRIESAGTESIRRTPYSGDAGLSDSPDGSPATGLPYTVTAQLRSVHEYLSKALRGLDELMPKIHGKPSGVPEAEGSKSVAAVEILKGDAVVKRGSRKHPKGIGSGGEGRTR